MPDAEVLLDAEGPAAPPRANGELAFDAPWERRLFGVTMALCQRVFSYADFRERLMVRVGEAPTRPYWRSWAAALEDALADTCALDPGVIEARHQEFLARPHGHDH
ncbi:SH3-like domain-containing protein [Mycolicibacterium arseniciresistens]|uniref:Nitrile hydratase subunit beta n=1 Tax=Mycolicibacterium arseniciresistens TaxID=3062257 RepID=A0ABT8UKK1_9MYCO|nr:SH3-like domain-containing protein [Mycolicibacterium arseniciresistens]MDO3638329.1 nitrile hydratase subunit beta [Mycolicibacterium arseniciresistens]